jgi:hypothetical protein
MSFDLLEHVQPEGGLYAIVGIRDGKVKQRLVETREEADSLIGMFLAQKRDVFFGVAKYESDGGGRRQENVKALKAFWLDIDCGPTKDYPDQPSGMKALRKFCNHTGLPTPTIVSSGRGLHVYWALEEEITREVWEPVAARLRGVCKTQGLRVDDKVFEAARVLRVPGTFNYKGETPEPVTVLVEGDVLPLAEFCSILGVAVPQKRSIFDPGYKSTAAEDAAISAVGYSFERILKRSAAGEGCAQIAHWVANAATADYNEWFYTLSVAAMCEDADTAIHTVSKDHPDYDPMEVERKAKSIRKSTSCARFTQLNPTLCEGCAFSGKIKGPRELGALPKESEDNYIVSLVAGPDNQEETQTLELPNCPSPFYRASDGSLWYTPPASKETGESGEPFLLYKNCFYAFKRVHDANNGGDTIVFRLHLPNDPVREFSIHANKVLQKDELRKELTGWGSTVRGKKFDLLIEYVALSVEQLQDSRKAEIMRQQFGWVDNMSRFVLGDQEITADGAIYSPPSKTTRALAKYVKPKGSFEKWKEVWALYGMKGMEPHAFAALSTFGAPLLRFFNQTGAVINLYNPRSGTGKTTILNMVNSVWGHPKELRLKQDDTMNGRLLWVGILNNLPATMDELTNATAKDYSDILYALSNGKGKERMMSGSNELRENNTSWQTITVSTSNASFAEKLSTLKANPEGELMRLFEYPIGLVEEVGTDTGKQLFDAVLMENYGHAGPIYIRYVLNNLETVKKLCAFTQSKIDEELGLLPKERFWSATIAANIVGGIIARKLKLIDWTVDAVYQWACGQVERLRVETAPTMSDPEEIIGDYLNRNMQNILVIDDADTRTATKPLPKREPKGELRVRVEPNTKMMFLAVKPFRDYCVDQQINYNETLRRLKERGRVVKNDLRRLGKGLSGMMGSPVQCIWLTIDNEFIESNGFNESGNAD